jgi:hypothetical protein
MNSNENSFDRLVAGISNDERVILFEKLNSTIDPESQSLQVEENSAAEQPTDIVLRLQSESVFVRIWMFIKALFTSNDIEVVYNRHVLKNNGKKIAFDNPEMYNAKYRLLLSGFYEQLKALKEVSNFFKPSIALYEDGQGPFFVFLGSLIVPELAERMEKEVSPYSLSFSREVTSETRTSLVRKMEEMLTGMPSSQRAVLYASIQSLDWLAQFVRLPFDRFLSRFTELPNGTLNCSLELIQSELAQFAKILCNGKRISTEVLEALFLFSAQKKQNEGEKIDITLEASTYLNDAIGQIGRIKTFIKTVPLRSISMIAFDSCLWTPELPEGVEDWFLKYKAQWKKIFDQKWEDWLKDKKKEQTKERIKRLFHVAELPLVPNRPWSEVWNGILCSREYSLGFLYAFFEQLYPSYSAIMKIVLVDGEFSQRDLRVEFTDIYNEFNHLSETILSLNDKLSPKGIYGESFLRIIRESIRTIQGQNKINSLMLSIESEANLLVSKFCDNCRSMLMLMAGFLAQSKESRYSTLSNITTLSGVKDGSLREQLNDVKIGLELAFDLIKEIETIEDKPVRK